MRLTMYTTVDRQETIKPEANFVRFPVSYERNGGTTGKALGRDKDIVMGPENIRTGAQMGGWGEWR